MTSPWPSQPYYHNRMIGIGDKKTHRRVTNKIPPTIDLNTRPNVRDNRLANKMGHLVGLSPMVLYRAIGM